jgi:2-methylisocitrate lyase-like PEP mutase family enzyme
MTPLAKRQAFRAILNRSTTTLMPGGFSPIYALMAERIGFECFFVAGSQVATFLLGVPDAGILGLRDMVDHVRHVAARCSIPILADCDTGFGNAVNVAYTVEEVIRSGAAGLQIEDQEAPKKSGTLSGRRCIDLDEAAGKIRSAVAARDALDPAFVICARCDAIGSEASSFEDALERCRTYAASGADLVWLNSVQSTDQVRRAAQAVAAPLLVAWGGPGMGPTIDEYTALGARIALFPTIASTAGLDASWHVLNDLHARGPVAIHDYQTDMRARGWGAVNRRELLQNERVRELEERFIPSAQRREY